jgi:hypothetical protein
MLFDESDECLESIMGMGGYVRHVVSFGFDVFPAIRMSVLFLMYSCCPDTQRTAIGK